MEDDANKLPEKGGRPEEEEPEELGLPHEAIEIFEQIDEIVDSEEIPEEEKKRLIRQTFTKTFVRFFRGPAPPPWIVGGYDKVVPGGGQWLLDYTKDEQRHRHQIDLKTTSYYSRGQNMAFVLGLVGLLGGIVTILLGKEIEGLSVFVPTLASMVGLFLYTQRQEKKEDDEKKKVLAELLDKVSDDE